MADYITIDGGTTNTRLHLVRSGQVVDTLRFPVGARAGIDDKAPLEEAVRSGIAAVLEKHSLHPSDITRVLASGMITSEFGLCSLPHISAPAGLRQLHGSMYETVLAHISPIPFVFIRGVRTEGDLDRVDMMRGEETELMGLYRRPGVYILPGSHSKFIRTDGAGRITDLKTMLTGEMIAALSAHTILKDAVQLSSCILEEYLHKGFAYADTHSVSEALFKTRILKNCFGAQPDAVYSFYMGALLAPELQYVRSLNAPNITVSGSRAIREPLAILLRTHSNAQITVIADEEAEIACARGAVRIFEYQEETL